MRDHYGHIVLIGVGHGMTGSIADSGVIIVENKPTLKEIPIKAFPTYIPEVVMPHIPKPHKFTKQVKTSYKRMK